MGTNASAGGGERTSCIDRQARGHLPPLRCVLAVCWNIILKDSPLRDARSGPTRHGCGGKCAGRVALPRNQRVARPPVSFEDAVGGGKATGKADGECGIPDDVLRFQKVIVRHVLVGS